MSFKHQDYYYNKAKKENFVARSIYKLEEIDKKYKILSDCESVVDLGYYPGSWLQYCINKLPADKKKVGIDIQKINKKFELYPGVHLFQKDIFEISNLEDIDVDKKFSLLLSDMAPKTTGIKSVDQDRSLSLVEKIFDIMPLFLENGGNTVIKVFESNDSMKFVKEKEKLFNVSKRLKPKATRNTSKEFFFIGKGYRAE